MYKRKSSNVIVRVGDEDCNFDPRKKFSIKKTKLLNIEWNNKYNASKIDLSSGVQSRFNDLFLYHQNANIVPEFNIQRY